MHGTMRLARSILLASVPVLTLGLPTDDRSGPVVDLGYVKLLGTSNATMNTTYYQGIRYAAPLSNQDRWRELTPIEMRNNYQAGVVYNATAPGSACIQLDGLLDYPLPQSEDCLFINVQTPMNAKSTTLLPVQVNIHGGGYVGGSAVTDSLVYHSHGGLISVYVQYRLGVMGFLAGSDVAANGALNLGLLDQRAALDWVQRNIRYFGGDPNRVTVWGGSAGGGSVTLQMIAGGAVGQPPFQAAYASYPGIFTMLNQSQQESQYRYTLDIANCSDIQCLRSLDTTQMEYVNLKALNSSSTFGPDPVPTVYTFGPVVDGTFIRDFPSLEFNRGHFHDVPLMVTRNGYEGYQFGKEDQTQIESTADARNTFPFAGESFFSRMYKVYNGSDFNSTFWQRVQWYGDWLINCPTYQMASAAVDRNQNQSAVFKVVFDAGSQIHGAIDDFIFSPTNDWPNANNLTLAEIMTAYHMSFIMHHDPNVGKLPNAPRWPSYHSGGSGNVADGESVGFNTLAVTYASIEAQRDPDESERCDFFAARSAEAGK